MLAEDVPAVKSEAPAEHPVQQAEPPAPTGDTTPEAPPASKEVPEDNSPTVPRKAMEDFRRKWQESEREKQEYAKQLAEFQQRMARPQQPEQQYQPPDPYTDPDGWAAHQNAVHQHELYKTRVDLSTYLMKKEAPDYDEVTAVFVEHAGRNPILWQQIRAHPMPAQFAYEEGKKLKLLNEISADPTGYEQKVIEKYLASQGQAGTQQRPPVNTPLPKSLASAPSAVARDPKGRYASQSGPPTLSQLLGEG